MAAYCNGILAYQKYQRWNGKKLRQRTIEGFVDDFLDENEDPHSQMQPVQYNWPPVERALPYSSMSQLGSGLPSQLDQSSGSGLPSQISPSQFDPSNSNISASEKQGYYLITSLNYVSSSQILSFVSLEFCIKFVNIQLQSRDISLDCHKTCKNS